MRAGILAGITTLAALAGGPAGSAPAPTDPGAYAVAHGWPVLPDNEMLDEVSAVAVDRRGDVFVLMRAGRQWPESGQFDTTAIAKPTVFVFDGRSGRLLRRWGEGTMALPHSITIDADDQVWVADVALHQVLKFSHDGRLLMTLGERAVPGSDERHFFKPADVAIGPDGSVFVADGYGNSRIVKFSAGGAFVRAWGSKGHQPGEFDLVHSVAVDGQGRVFAVDRNNKRIQVFDADGRFLFQWPGPPFISPQTIRLGPHGRMFVDESGDTTPPDETGVLVLDAQGRFVTRIGRYGNYDGQVVDPHWVALGADGAVYIADFAGKRVQKFTPRR